MKILDQHISDMHLWAVTLLFLLVVVSSYSLHTIPWPLIFGVVFAILIEISIRKFYLKHKLKIPVSSIITGIIIGSIAPINAPLFLIAVAVAIGILSKFILQFKNSNIFNPAAIGLIVALAIFGLGDEWWVASNYSIYGVAIALTPLLVILAYKARRVITAISFICIVLVLNLIFGGFSNPLSFTGAIVLLFSVNYYFAFVMLVEPKTSPHAKYAQMAYGSMAALIYFACASLRVPYSLLVALLLINFSYFIYKMYWKQRKNITNETQH